MQKSFVMAIFIAAVIFVSACIQQAGTTATTTTTATTVTPPVSDAEVNMLASDIVDLNTTSNDLNVQDFDIEVSLV